MEKERHNALRYLWQLVEVLELQGQIPQGAFVPGTVESSQALAGERTWLRGTPLDLPLQNRVLFQLRASVVHSAEFSACPPASVSLGTKSQQQESP